MLRELQFRLLFFCLIITNCSNDSIEANHCYEGTVIDKIRSWGGGIAVSMKEPTFSNHTWRNYDHAVEALNVPDSLWTPGKTIFFWARVATESERNFSSVI